MNTSRSSTFVMGRIREAALFLVALLVLTGSSSAQEDKKPQGFDAFRLVLSRNVFDPERRESRREESRSSSSVPAGTVRSSVTLTGTMVTGSKSLAFFGSSRSEYNKVASLQENVGDYKVVSIAPNEVTLEQAGQTTVLGVGKQLALAGTEPAPPGTPGETLAAPGALPAGASPTAAPSGPLSDKDEILRRMMQRRQQEISK